MGENSQIEWTDHSWSPWWGCTKISPACAHCYAAAMALRWRGIVYAKGVPRQRCGTAHWREPLRWNAKAQKTGVRLKVFPSMMDWLDDEVPVDWLADFLALIHATPYLDWLLLTKRPENWLSRMSAALEVMSGESEQWVKGWVFGADIPPRVPANVWIGATVENQEMADLRVPHLLAIPALVRFLSVEPMLGPVSIRETGLSSFDTTSVLHWVIGGGESGPGARPAHPEWFRSLRDECTASGVAFFFKQWGEFLPADSIVGTITSLSFPINGAHGPRHPEWMDWPDGWRSARVGKKAAGRRLDGREWNEFPKIKAKEVARG